MLVLSAGHATAVPVNASLDYRCVFPLIEEQPLSVEITSDMPATIPPGQSTGAFDIDATAQVSAEAWNGLSFVGTHELVGEVVAQSSISGPGVDLPLTLPMVIADRVLPENMGSFTVDASGQTPPLTFTANNLGKVDIRVGNLLMFLQPEDVNGNPTGLGHFESECTLAPGQDNRLHTLTVVEETQTDLIFSFNGEGLIKDDIVLPLSGQLETTLEADSMELTGDMQFDPSRLDVSIIRFFKTLTMDAAVHIDTVGALNGHVSNGNMNLQQSVNLDLDNLQLRVFGFPITLGKNNQCVSEQPIELDLTTPDGESFDPQTGGRLAGEFTLPDFTDCGVMTDLVNLFLSGADNTLSIMLNPES
ncbi:MAG: hypothetical protein MI745_15370 [Pseudomonadales bacterium]|nr:hypothetical protein [Pseudomonadales bacterium]